MRKVMRSVHEGARDLARALAAKDEWLVSCKERKKVEMLFAHLKRILKLDRLRLRGPNGARDEFHLAAAAQNLRKLAKAHPHAKPPGSSLKGSVPCFQTAASPGRGRVRLFQRHRPNSVVRKPAGERPLLEEAAVHERGSASQLVATSLVPIQ